MDEQRDGASKGTAWAWVMLAFIGIECMVLTEVFFFDRTNTSWSDHSGFLGPYYVICLVTLVLQVAGIALVAAGRYRFGGVLQVVASSIHLVKVEGIVGIVGGVLAYRYPDQAAAQGPDDSSPTPSAT